MAPSGAEIRPVHTLTHNNAVYWVAFSSDGKQLASASLDNTAKLWNVADGKNIGTLTGHTDGVAFVDYLKDGRLVTAGVDRALKIWSATGIDEATLSGHQEYMTCAAAARTSMLVVSGSQDKTVRLWDAQSGAALAVLEGHEATVRAVAISPDAMSVASGGDDHAIRLWSVESRGPLRLLAGHPAAVEAIAFSPTEPLLASAGADGHVRLWRPEGAAVAELVTPASRLKSLTFSPDGRWLVAGGSDGILRIWSVPERRETAAIPAHRNTIYGVAFSPDGKRLASASFDRTIRLWEFAVAPVANK